MQSDESRLMQLDSSPELDVLLEALESATGAEAKIDEMIADSLRAKKNDYTSNAVACRELAGQMLPSARLQVGYDVSGVLPSATLSYTERLYSSVAPTVPLAILRVLFNAILQRER